MPEHIERLSIIMSTMLYSLGYRGDESPDLTPEQKAIIDIIDLLSDVFCEQEPMDFTKEDYEAIYGWGGQG